MTNVNENSDLVPSAETITLHHKAETMISEQRDKDNRIEVIGDKITSVRPIEPSNSNSPDQGLEMNFSIIS